MIRPRRDFLRQLTGAAIGSASWNALAAGPHAAGLTQDGPQSGEAYWRQLRRQFPLENGLTGELLREEAHAEFLHEPAKVPGLFAELLHRLHD